MPYRYAILVLPLDTRLVFIVKDFGNALLKTKSFPIFFSYKLSERKLLFEIAHCISNKTFTNQRRNINYTKDGQKLLAIIFFLFTWVHSYKDGSVYIKYEPLSYHLIWSVLHAWLHCSISIMTMYFEHY